jgi:hypothetical protein
VILLATGVATGRFTALLPRPSGFLAGYWGTVVPGMRAVTPVDGRGTGEALGGERSLLSSSHNGAVKGRIGTNRGHSAFSQLGSTGHDLQA